MIPYKARLSFSLIMLMILLALTGCSTTEKSEASVKKEEIVVFAAASLTEVFSDIEASYEALHPEHDIVYNFAGSQTLANQIAGGATPAMFFSANEKYVDMIIEKDLNPCNVREFNPVKTLFAANRLGIIYDGGYDFESLADVVATLASPERKPVILALEEVPVGKYTKKMMTAYLELTGDQAGYEAFYKQVASYESDVKAVVAKVRIHEGDMGIVYRTDAAVMDLEGNGLKYLDIDDAYNQTATYASLLFSNREGAKSFYSYLVEGDGQGYLEEAGFK